MSKVIWKPIVGFEDCGVDYRTMWARLNSYKKEKNIVHISN